MQGLDDFLGFIQQRNKEVHKHLKILKCLLIFHIIFTNNNTYIFLQLELNDYFGLITLGYQ